MKKKPSSQLECQLVVVKSRPKHFYSFEQFQSRWPQTASENTKSSLLSMNGRDILGWRIIRGFYSCLANVRNQEAPLASGATSCDSKNRDRSPEGTGLCCIALLGFFPIASSKSGPDPIVVTGLIICLILEIGLLVSMTKFLVNEYRSKKRENNRKDNGKRN